MRFGELLPLVITPWAPHQAAADAQVPRHRAVDQPAVDRVARLLTSQLATRLGMVRILSFSEQVMIVVLDAAMVSQEG